MEPIADKLEARGADALSDLELLALLVDDEALAERLLEAERGSLVRLSDEELPRLRMLGGLGLKRARLLLAAAEFGRRVAVERSSEGTVIGSTDDVAALFRPMLAHLEHEECWVLHLSSANRLICKQRVSTGGVQSTVVDLKLIIRCALHHLSSNLVLVHNHPSGAAVASQQDRDLTERVVRAAALLDMHVLDHVIVSREGSFSFRREGLLR